MNTKRFTVSEESAKVFRVWEELGGPHYLSMRNAKEIFFDEMSPIEQDEVPSWPKKDDRKMEFYYVLPVRLQRKITGQGESLS